MASSNPSGSPVPGLMPQVTPPENEAKPDDHQPLKTQLRLLIQADNIAEVEELLNQNRFLSNASVFYETEKNQRPVKCLVLPLTIAAIFGRVAILEMLLSKFNADVDAPTGTGSPSLHLAGEYGWLVAATHLLSHGADINRIDVWGWTALHHASRNARTDIVRFLLEKGANSRLRVNGGRTAFSLACSQGSLELLKLLWTQGPETQVSMPDLRGHQPLHHAAGDNNHRVIPWLLEKQADIEARGEIGLTPLCAASIAGSFEAAEALLFKGANIHAKSTLEKATPILYANQMLNSRLSLRLLEASASLADTDQRGYNCFHRMLENEGGSLQDFVETTILFVSSGASINHLSVGDVSPLAFACHQGKSVQAKILIGYGADVNQSGSRTGLTPLMLACKRPKNKEVITMLLDRCADDTKTNRGGGTALAMACLFGDSENVEILISRGSKVAQLDTLSAFASSKIQSRDIKRSYP